MCLVFFAGFSQIKHVVFFHSHCIVVLAESGSAHEADRGLITDRGGVAYVI